jgi:hypothetical protein
MYEIGFYTPPANMPVTREEILSEIRKFVTKNDEVPGERTFTLATRIKPSVWKGRYWARWTDVIREAGTDPLEMNQKIPDEEMLEARANFVTKLSYFPVRDEINIHARATPGLPVWTTIKKRFGGMPQMAASLLEFGCKTANAELIKLCEARLQRETLKPPSVTNNHTQALAKTGYVYLKYSPSLRLYKIGKADDPDKRGAGISLLLPEDLVPKHQIKTDCPLYPRKVLGEPFPCEEAAR